MNLMNAKSRFAWDPTTSRIYDYLTNKHHVPDGILHDKHGGSWDLKHLGHLLRNNQFIESAHFRDLDPAQPEKNPPAAKGKAKDLTHHELAGPQTADGEPVRNDPGAQPPIGAAAADAAAGAAEANAQTAADAASEARATANDAAAREAADAGQSTAQPSGQPAMADDDLPPTDSSATGLAGAQTESIGANNVTTDNGATQGTT